MLKDFKRSVGDAFEYSEQLTFIKIEDFCQNLPGSLAASSILSHAMGEFSHTSERERTQKNVSLFGFDMQSALFDFHFSVHHTFEDSQGHDMATSR